MRILLAEDDPLLGDGLQAGLSQLGFQVDWVRDGVAAEHELRAEAHAAAVLDLGLPRRDGMDVLSAVRRAGIRVPVLVLTARDGVPERAYETSANRYDVTGSRAYRFSPRHHVSANGRYERDDFSPYEYQGTVAVGLGSRFIDNDTTKFSGEIGPGYRSARTRDGDLQSSVITRGQLDLRHQLTDNTEVFNTLLVEAGADNTFAQNDLGLSVAMNERLALKAGVQARHNSEVEDADTKRTDTLTTVNLVYTFR